MRRGEETKLAIVGAFGEAIPRVVRLAHALRASVVTFPTVVEAVESATAWVLFVPNGAPTDVGNRLSQRSFVPVVAIIPEPTEPLPDADEVFTFDELGVRAVSRLRTLRRTAELLDEAVATSGAGREALATMRDLAAAAESVEDRTGGHPLRVAALCRSIALEMGLSESETEAIAAASLLHDLGKARVPSRILTKPGKLTPEEYAVVRRHTEFGSAWLERSDSDWIRESGRVARSHHERWDGTGYPDGLVGAEIPVGSRIAAVADVFDALTSDRSYKPAWKPRQALEEIEAGAGSQFDPDAVRALLSLRNGRLAHPGQ
jgi:HD-GYP domain-containing protein (c-di-GMP phosphodiesterase class II)